MKRISALLFAVTTLALGACSDSQDPAAPELGDDTILTQAEASMLAQIFTGDALGSADVPGAGAQAPSAVPFDFNVALTLPCPLGGEVAFEGTMTGDVDPEGDRIDLQVTASQVHSACAVEAEGVTVTVSGDPGLQFSSSILAEGNPPVGTQDASLTGGFTWETSDGRGGACTVDLTANVQVGSHAGTLSGSFCGYGLDVTLGG